MKSLRFLAPRTLPLLTALLLLAGLAPARAQYTDHFQTNTITAFTSWPGDYFVGSNTWGDVLLIQSGGILTNAYGYVGYQSNSLNNVVTVAGAGSVWSNRNDLSVGYFGSGNRLLITNGGAVFNGFGYVGTFSSSSSNLVTVARSGSVWRNRNDLYVGYAGSGNQLLITNGGKVFNGVGYVGYNASSSNNVVTVAGSGSVWSNTSSLYFGTYGSGNQLLITNGGAVFAGNGFVGHVSSSSNNAVTVAGLGSVWSNRNDLYVGNGGSDNQLLIANGGKVFNGFGYVGYSASGCSNVVAVSGGGSVWSNSSSLYVGYMGSGNQLLISSGGKVINGFGYVGHVSSSSNNAVTVAGLGSVWSNRIELCVGHYGSGNQLLITNGGAVFSSAGYVGAFSSSSNNMVTVAGSGSVWNNRSSLLVGYNGSGNQLLVTNGGRVVAVGSVGLGTQAGAMGNGIQVLGGGMLSASNLALTRGSYVSQGGTNTFGYGMTIGALGNLTVDASSQLAVSGLVQNAGTVTLGGLNTVGAANPWQSLGGATNQFSGGLAIAAGGVFQASSNGTSVVGGSVSNSGTILVDGGSSLGFLGPAVTANGTVGFRGTNAAPVAGLAGMAYSGNNALWLDASTNAAVASYLLDSAANTGNATNYQALLLTGVNPLWQSGALTVGDGGQLMVSNASGAAIGAVLTNSGAIHVFNSSVGWLNDAVFNTGSRFLSQASSNTFSGNLTVDPGASFVQSADSWFSVLGNYVNQGSATYSNTVTVTGGQTYQSTGATNDFAGGLTIASGGGLNVGQGASVVGGVITNLGLINVLNGSVAFNNPVVNLGAYVSDPSTNTFNGTLTVGPTGYVSAAAGDVYAFGADFVMGSTNAAFNMASAVAYFGSTNYGITTGMTSHTFDLSGSGAMDIGTGYTNFSQVAANYAIGTLSVGVSNRLTITGMRSGGTTNALYIRLLDIPWADTNSFAGVTNTLMQALYLPDINVYYDYYSGENAWLNEYLPGTGYDLWGGGKLLPIPEPSGLALLALALGAGLVVRMGRKPSGR